MGDEWWVWGWNSLRPIVRYREATVSIGGGKG